MSASDLIPELVRDAAHAAREKRIANKIEAMKPGWDLAATVLEGWASGFLTEGDTSKTLKLAAKDLRENRDKVLESWARNIGVPPCDSDGTATAAACEDMPVPQDCQARAESIAQKQSSSESPINDRR